MVRDVFVEVHDFGFGPACGFLDMTERFADQYRWHVLAVGNAAAFIRKERPGVNVISFNGFSKDNWHGLASIVPKESPLVTFSNPGFAAYAAQQWNKVCLVDQLDWMWPTYPDGIDDVDLHLVQHYFGQAHQKPRAPNAIEIRPIVTPSAFIGADNANRLGTVVGLGGMAIAGNSKGGDSYAEWLLPHIISGLDGTPEAFPVSVVGGSPNLETIVSRLGDRRVSSAVGVRRHSYMGLLRGSRYQILTPGLASIYEAAVTGLKPLFQPGVNKSMLLQLDSLIEKNYPFAVAWPWFDEIKDQFASLSAADSLDLITRRIAGSIRNEDKSGEMIRTSVADYLSRHQDGHLTIDLPIDLPDGGSLLQAALQFS